MIDSSPETTGFDCPDCGYPFRWTFEEAFREDSHHAQAVTCPECPERWAVGFYQGRIYGPVRWRWDEPEELVHERLIEEYGPVLVERMAEELDLPEEDLEHIYATILFRRRHPWLARLVPDWLLARLHAWGWL